MAVFSLEIADEDVQRVLDAICANYRRVEMVANPDWIEGDEGSPEEIENPETKGEFTHRMVRRFLSEHVQSHELELARSQAVAAVDVSITINDPEV
jgi:hypothetical protein